jgi:hypothetical protein
MDSQGDYTISHAENNNAPPSRMWSLPLTVTRKSFNI